uniref:Cuticle protein 6 n=1 Tax=Anopheles coluzzii TaxID=1518534 RepID=A0A6E8W2L6_ANOCL
MTVNMSPLGGGRWRCLASLLIFTILARIVRAEQEVIVAIDEPGKTQYHEANFNTSSYQYGYEVGPNGQFHHETRGPDGVTYGCYGYIDPNGQLRVTHYVADTHGYRVVEPNRPVEIFVDAPTQYSNSIAEEEPQERRRGELRPWTELYLPKGCGMFPGGMRPDGGSGGASPPTGGISLGAGVSTAGISGTASTSHTGPNHNVMGTIGGSIGSSTGVQTSAGVNASATGLGVTVDHTHTSNVTVTGESVQVTHGGQNTIDSQQVTVAGTVGVAVGVEAGLIDSSLNHTGHVSVGSIDVSSATAVGAGIVANHTTIGGVAQLTHNASISIPTVAPGSMPHRKLTQRIIRIR